MRFPVKLLYAACALSATLLVMALAGCGTTSSTSGSYGADAGPWPQAPTRTMPPVTADTTPTARVMVLLRAKTARDNEELQLTAQQIDLKYTDPKTNAVQWVPICTKANIAAIETMPLRFGPKGSVTLLVKTQIPQRKYTQLRVRFDDGKSLLLNTDPAVIPAQKWSVNTASPVLLDLGEWTPDDKNPNMLMVTLDGNQVTKNGAAATLPLAGFSVSNSVPPAGISAKLLPPLPTAHVDVFWGKTKTLLDSATPGADGVFTINHLPPGSYRLELTTPGYHQIDPRKDPVSVEDKVVTLSDIQLTPAK